MLSFADFGVGNGVLSSVATAHGKDDKRLIQRIVSSGFFILLGIALVVFFVVFLIYPFVSWYRVFNVESDRARAEAGPAIAVFLTIFAVNIPLGIVQRVQIGLQQSFHASLWQCFGSALSLIGILLAIYFEVSLPWLVGALAGAPTVAYIGNNAYFFIFSRPDLIPKIDMVSKETMLNIFKTGSLFFVLQIVMAVAYTSDNLIIAQVLGAASVAEYAVPDKLFSLVVVAIAMILAPLWPAYGEAIARGDDLWVRKTLRKSIIISIVFSFFISGSLVIFGPFVISLWVGHAINPPFLLLLGLGVWKTIEAGAGALAVFLNGTNVVGLQIVLSSATAIAAFALKIYAVLNFNVSGVPWAMIIAFCIFTIFPYIYFLPKIIRSMGGINA